MTSCQKSVPETSRRSSRKVNERDRPTIQTRSASPVISHNWKRKTFSKCVMSRRNLMIFWRDGFSQAGGGGCVFIGDYVSCLAIQARSSTTKRQQHQPTCSWGRYGETCTRNHVCFPELRDVPPADCSCVPNYFSPSPSERVWIVLVSLHSPATTGQTAWSPPQMLHNAILHA